MPSLKGSAVLHAKLLSDIRQIRTRLAVTIVIAEEGDDTALPCEDHVIENPSVSTLLQPPLSTVPLQVFVASEWAVRLRSYRRGQPVVPLHSS